MAMQAVFRGKPAAMILLWALTAAAATGADSAPAGSQPAATQPAGESAGATAACAQAAAGDLEKASVTTHEVRIGDRSVRYRATAAAMPMKDESDKLKATVFFVAYEAFRPGSTAEGDADLLAAEPEARPITFVFNGGPGAAAVWLHLGTAGPRRVDFPEDGTAPPPPYRLVDNAWSWLDVTDLVFIDPVGTGFSRPAEGQDRQEFYGVREDIRWVAEFIRLYLTRYRRWASPAFLAGESYGTTRAAGLSEHLLDRHGIALCGIVFVSTVLDFQTLSPQNANDLPYPLFLPTYTATAWYHRRLDAELQADFDRTLREVQQWATGDYVAALAAGNALQGEPRRQVLQRLARYTGLPEEFIERASLRVTPAAFQKHLLADKGLLVGRFDSRITGHDPSPLSNRPAFDPSLPQYLAAYSACFNDYARRQLKYESLLPYEVLSDKVRPWNFGEDGMGYLSVVDELRSAMVKNPHLRLLFASGYFDLATPYWGTQYTIDHLDLPPELTAHIRHERYPAGHMMYHERGSLRKLKADVADFIRQAVAGRRPTADGK